MYTLYEYICRWTISIIRFKLQIQFCIFVRRIQYRHTQIPKTEIALSVNVFSFKQFKRQTYKILLLKYDYNYYYFTFFKDILSILCNVYCQNQIKISPKNEN